MHAQQPSRRATPRVSATASAVRKALLLSTAAVALAGSAGAFAQTCTQTGAPNEVTCTGVFTDNVTNSIPPANLLLPDLTLVIGDPANSATTVTPPTGIDGLTLIETGTVTVTTYGDFFTSGADGIYQNGSVAAALSVYADITSEVLALGDNAIEIRSPGNVDVIIGGDVLAYNDGVVDVTTLVINSTNTDVNLLVDYGGSVTADAYDGDAIAIIAGADNNLYATNDGIVQATSAYGYAIGVLGIANDGDALAINSGQVSAYAYTDAAALVAASKYGDTAVVNLDTLVATAAGGLDVSAIALVAGGAYVDVYQGDTLTATATGVDAADAVGAYIAATAGVYVENAGDIYASATADALVGTATAIGIDATGSYIDAYNIGTITTFADGAFGRATAVVLNAADAIYAYNGGDLFATAEGGATATGLSANITAAGNIEIFNDGLIDALSEDAAATGVLAATALGDILVTNFGEIYAAANPGYDATGVQVCAGGGTATVENFGTIAADVAISSCAATTVVINNDGEIDGDIVTGDGDDYIYNSDTISGSMDLGAGDDSIVNEDTINLDDDTIDLGLPGLAGNSFDNNGTINVEGDSVIAMGLANPLAFCNDGIIDFQDGAPNDSLTIVGDFACDGVLNVDVSGLNSVSDMLYIDGDVAADSNTTINVDLLDLGPGIEDLIPIVEVTGTSVAGNFALGTVDWDEDNSFVGLGFSLDADIDATNVTPDVFSLAIAITALSDPGTIAASVAPGVQSLMNSQVGTWRQRMGVIDGFNKGAVALWARVFTDKGSFTPGHFATNFGQGGNYDWDQKNSGIEAGIDFSVTDEFSIGLLAAKSEAKLRLDNPGFGEADLDADTWGVYGTWISPNGMYLDASYRWMSFEVDMNSVAGGMAAEGDAESFNVELGYAWTLSGGLKIEPQLQYTKTNVENIDVFVTSTGMEFQSFGGDSERGRLGVALRKSFGDADTGWQWTPHATLSAVREFDGENSFAVNDTFVGTTSAEGTSALLELGFNARHRNLAFYGGVNWQDGGAMNSFVGGQLGVRYTFGGSAPAPAPVVVVAPAKTCADLDDDGDGVNNCDDRCPGSTAGQAIGLDGCAVPAPAPEPEPVMEPKPFRG